MTRRTAVLVREVIAVCHPVAPLTGVNAEAVAAAETERGITGAALLVRAVGTVALVVAADVPAAVDARAVAALVLAFQVGHLAVREIDQVTQTLRTVIKKRLRTYFVPERLKPISHLLFA